MQIICPAGKEIEITPTSFGASVCTQRIAEQTVSKGHVLYANNAEPGTKMDYMVNATVEGISYTGTGGACGTSGSNVTYSGQTTIKGYEDESHKSRDAVTVATEGAPVTYPFTVPGAGASQKTFLTGEGTAKPVLNTSGTVECTSSSFSGSVSGPEQTSVTLIPTYIGCSAFGFAITQTKTNGCTYRFEVTAEPSAETYTGKPFQIICPAGKEIEITPTSFGVSVCTQKIAEQTPSKGHVVYTNNAELGVQMDYLVNATVEGISYTGTGGACGNSGSNATYSGQTTLKGYEDEAHKLRSGVTVAVPGSPIFPFTAPGAGASSPTYLTGHTTSSHIFSAQAGTFKCTSVSFSGSLVGPERSSVTLVPAYSGCSIFAFVAIHFKTNGCTYRFPAPTTEPSTGTYTGEPPQIVCPAGKEMEITWTSSGSSVCTQKIAEQSPAKGHVEYTNNTEPGGTMDYEMEAVLEGIVISSTGSLCGKAETGTFSGGTTIRGYSNAGHSISFGVTVA